MNALTFRRAMADLHSPHTEPGDREYIEEWMDDRAAKAQGFEGFDDPAWIEHKETAA